MSLKGFFKINILELTSQYFSKSKNNYYLHIESHNQYSLIIKSDDIHHYATSKCIYYPRTDNIQFRITQNIDEDQNDQIKQGYFNLPASKIHHYPHKNHIININCIWRQQKSKKICETLSENSALLKISLVFLENLTANIDFLVDQLVLDSSLNSHNKKLDLFLDIKSDDISNQTTIKQQINPEIKWNETLTFTLQNLPSKFLIDLRDKDVMNDDEALGSTQINPFQDEYFIQSKGKYITRQLILTNKTQKIGKLWVKTLFKFNS